MKLSKAIMESASHPTLDIITDDGIVTWGCKLCVEIAKRHGFKRGKGRRFHCENCPARKEILVAMNGSSHGYRHSNCAALGRDARIGSAMAGGQGEKAYEDTLCIVQELAKACEMMND